MIALSEMNVNGLFCDFHMPPASKETMHDRLPPRAPVQAHCVDDYHCPDNWMHGSGKASSYFVPVRDGCGMWLDFNSNAAHVRNVAILLSIQGINPITGMKTDKMRLERYENKCPKHDLEFGGERYCDKCGYKWDRQNYLASAGTPSGVLWLDGFRAEDGVIRQYVFTKDAMKGVAAQIIGEDRVFAIGIAFYLSKDLKPVPPVTQYGNYSPKKYGYTHPNKHYMLPQTTDGMYGGPLSHGHTYNTGHTGGGTQSSSGPSGQSSGGGHKFGSMRSLSMPDSGKSVLRTANLAAPETTLEIGAGHKIDQKVYPDTLDLGDYEDTPAGMLYINYVPSVEAVKILERGMRDRTAEGDGFMKNVEKVV